MDAMRLVLTMAIVACLMPSSFAVRATGAEPVQRPWIIGHRGACGYRPEHTLASYQLAIDMGADYVEPDLVSTKDGVLICRHDCEIGSTTDAAQTFPERRKTAIIDGQKLEGWFAADFTLAEIKSLRARERTAFRSHKYDGLFEVPTFQELIDLVQAQSRARGRSIGIIPETKHPTYHDQLGLALEKPLLKILAASGYTAADSPCVIQSFEIDNLRELSRKTKVKLLQLLGEPHQQPGDVLARRGTLTYREMQSPRGLAEVAKYAWGVGPWKETILPRDAQNRLLPATPLIDDAHRAGLAVVIYTLRNEPQYLSADDVGDPRNELRRWFKLHVDALFTDFPDTAVQARAAYTRP